MCLGMPGLLESKTGEGLELRGRARFGGVVREVSLAFVPEAEVGDYIIVHVGVAISILQKDRAAQIAQTVDQLAEMHESENVP